MHDHGEDHMIEREDYEAERRARRAARREAARQAYAKIREIGSRRVVIHLAPAPLWTILLALAAVMWVTATIYDWGVTQGQLSALDEAYEIVRTGR